MTKPIVLETIDYLNTWKNAFMSSSDYTLETSLGITELRDYLDNIEVNGIKCYASHLFNQLTAADRLEVESHIDFLIDFDNLYATYPF